MTSIEKKQAEHRLIEEARRRGNFFPSGRLSEYESPDWLIRDASLGIEVSDILPPKGTNLFSGPQISAFQSDVVEMARCQYHTNGYGRADVLVYFHNEWNQKRDAKVMATALAGFVQRNLPLESDCITLQEHDIEEWVDGLSVIRISRRGDRWQAGAAAGLHNLRQVDLASRICAKNKLLKQYRARLPGWEIWLLLTTEIRVLRSVAIPHDISEWRFAYDFNRVLLMPWEGGVIELSRSESLVSAKSS
ncbi:MAG: hypothetical protein JWO48_3821 [Bryobacterales bacterium]|nr:hypothetical protein [Bryobacterales bacterium]